MLVSEFISLAKDGPLNQTTITDADLLKFTNIGLIELFSKFNLSNPTQEITLIEGTSSYNLNTNFISIISITTPGIYYRNNLGVISPISDDIFNVPVNVQGDFNSVFHNSNLVLTVPLQVTGQKYTIVYRAAPTTLTTQSLNTTLDILPQYIEPLMLYVTYLGFMQNGGGTTTDTNLYLSRYKAAVQELINVGSYQSHYSLDNKFYNRGFI